MNPVSPLTISCNNLNIGSEGKSTVLKALLKGSNGKEYHIRVVGKDEAEVKEIFKEQKLRAIAIFEAVGEKPIELSGKKFDTLKKGSASSTSGKKIDPNCENYIQSKDSKIKERQAKLNSAMEAFGKDEKKDQLNSTLDALKKEGTLTEKEVEKIKAGELAPLENLLKKLAPRIKQLDLATSVFHATFVEGESVKKSKPAKKEEEDELKSIDNALPPVPVGGIKSGCVNRSNSCWLNASLKLMAAQNHFDALLNAKFPESKPDDSEPLKNLRSVVPFLKIAVNGLRSGKNVTQTQGDAILAGVSDAKYVTGRNGAAVDITGQHDGAEFLESLLADWAKLKEGEISGLEPYKKPVFQQEDIESRPLVNIIPESKDEIVMHNEHFLPEQSGKSIVVNVQRHIQKVEQEDQNFVGTERCDAPLSIHKSGASYQIALNGHEYRVKGVMSQTGGTDAGHWTYLEIHTNGKVFSHSDMTLQEISEEKVLEELNKGAVLYLEKTDLEDVD